MSFDPGTADLLTAAHVPRCACDDHTALHQPGELIDLHRIVTAVCHRDHDHVGGRLSDTESERLGRPAPERVVHGPQLRLVLRIAFEKRHGRVLDRVVDHQHLRRQCDRLENPIEEGHHRGTLVVRGDDNADAWFQTVTPLPSRLVMSTTGLSVCSSPYARCGAAIMSRSDSATTVSKGRMSGSPVT